MNKKLIRLTESDLHRIVRESVNIVLNEVQFGGESLHGNNPEDWVAIRKVRNTLGNTRNIGNYKRNYPNKHYDNAERADHNSWELYQQEPLHDEYDDARIYGGGRAKGRRINDKLGIGQFEGHPF